MTETAQILPKNYYQILLKRRVVNEGRETNDCSIWNILKQENYV